METLDAKKVLEFLRLVHNLKHAPRRGWAYKGIQNPESIASHMYNMGIMTFLLGDNPKIDRVKCLQLAVVHDLAECIVGDITPHDNIPVDVKHKLEDEALKRLIGTLDSKEIGDKIYELYKEYEKKETPESKFVKDLDRFDLVFTASEYERKEEGSEELQEFFDVTRGGFNHPFINTLACELENQRHPKKEV